MKTLSQFLFAMMLGGAMVGTNLSGQTDGRAKFEVTIADFNGAGTAHWTVAWVTYQNGTFIKSLRKQGPAITASHWNSHCGVWYTAKGSNTNLDGYSSATATTYSGTNSPVVWTWNCRDANNNVVPDGSYKFWIQYAEDSGQGPHTTNGMSWVKGPAAATSNYPSMAANFSGLRVTWTPTTPPTVAPTITSASPPATGAVGVPYAFSCTATGTTPLTFTAVGLPTGLAISSAGAISGTPSVAGSFNGTITVTNGTPPNATQNFSIVMSVVPAAITGVQLSGNDLVLSGDGPANGIYAVLVSTNVDALPAGWTAIATNSINSAGELSFTNTIGSGVPKKFYRLRLP